MMTPDLKSVREGNLWKGSIDVARLAEKDGAAAIEIDKEDFNLIWLDEFEFTNGIIEFDAKGKSTPTQGSFVGMAFRVVDEETYDAIYFRPFNFQSADEDRRSHAVQYISLPEWPWYRSRQERNGQYEKPINPAPDGDLWFHAKIVVNDQRVKVFVNDAEEPALEVTELSGRSGGSVGLWCFGYGVISNVRVLAQ